MTIYQFEDLTPDIHPTAFIAPTASVIGAVTIAEGASVWYGTVLRADFGPITIGRNANVQDGSILHATDEGPIVIAASASIGHNCVLHGATVGEGSLIANGATVLDGTVIGSGSLVAAGSLVLPGTEIPDGVVVAGSPAKVRGEVEGTGAAHWLEITSPAYAELAARHRDGIRPIGDSA